MIIENLIADEYGSYIGKYKGRLKVTRKGETLASAPLMHLKTVYVIGSGISISSDAIDACSEVGIPIFFLNSLGNSTASLYSSGLNATIITRREQLKAYDTGVGVDIAINVIRAKIHNQASTLKYVAKNRKDTYPDLYNLLRDFATDIQACAESLEVFSGHIDEIRMKIMGIEGRASTMYWQGLRLVIPEEYNWTNRITRGATDPINSLLNYGYGILYTQVERALILAGLEPYAGFLHADRPGKPSLVLDLVEEFRSVAIDRVVLGLANRKYTIQISEDGLLESELRRDFAEKVLSHLEQPVRYKGKKISLRLVIQQQARHLASTLRDKNSLYSGYLGTY